MKVPFKVILVTALLLFALVMTGCESQQIFLPANIVLFNLHEFGRVAQNVVYKNLPDIPLTMDIYFPFTARNPVPAVMYIHGGGWYSGDKRTGAGQADIPELLKRGYLVASVDYRLAPKYKFPAQIEDVKCAIRFLRSQADTYGIDPENIGVYGDSAGGHLAALLGLTCDSTAFECQCLYEQQSESVQAVVDLFGPANLMKKYEADTTLHMEHVFGTTDPDAQLIREASPVTYAHEKAPPFLIIHGDQDTQVLHEQSEELYARLIEADATAQLVIINNCEHGFKPTEDILDPCRDDITELIADFFDQNLKGM